MSTSSNYQDVLTRVRAWVPTYGHQFDAWRARWDLAEDTPGSHTPQGSLAQLYLSQVQRALYQLVREGVLLKSGQSYATPAVIRAQAEQRQREEAEAQVLTARWKAAGDVLERLGFEPFYDSNGTWRLGLEDTERLVSQYLDDGGS